MRIRIVLGVILGMFIVAGLLSVYGIAIAQSCSTPAANFATLTSCKNQTAQALRSTSTQARTLTATPTKVTPVPTLVELIVFVKVFIKFANNQSVDSGIFPWSTNQPVSCQFVRIDNFPQPTATLQGTP